jgi:glycosyltransferase involved in cell wall biosynthesis
MRWAEGAEVFVSGEKAVRDRGSVSRTGTNRKYPSLLIVTTVAPTHGFLLPFARHFRSLGWRIDGCANGISGYEPAAGCYDAMYELPLSRSIKDFRGMSQTVRALRTIVAGDYDIVHVHTPIAAFLTRAIIRRMPSKDRPKVVYTAHGFHFHAGGHPVSNQAFVLAERIAGRWTDRLIVINSEDHEAARRYKIVPSRRLRYMRGIGVDTEWYSRDMLAAGSVRRALQGIGMDGQRRYFVTVGEFSRRKRPEDVIRALARMQAQDNALLLLGEGARRPYLEEVALQAGVSERVFMPGKVSDIRPFVAGAIALVQASSREGLPRSIMEALSLEVPVIATDARGQEELVGRERGVTVPIGAVDDLASAMDRLALHSDAATAMGVRGRQLMIERYDLKRIIGEHERLYGELLAP